jgi:hypothetical protein
MGIIIGATPRLVTLLLLLLLVAVLGLSVGILALGQSCSVADPEA